MSLVPIAMAESSRVSLAHVDALKFDLRRRFSGVSSSHLTEAIAAGFGFRSNASLRSAIQRDAGQVLRLEMFDLQECEVRLRSLGHGVQLGSLCPGLEDEVRLQRLAALRRAPLDQARIEEEKKVQRRCALAFAERFNLGALHTDARVVWRAGIDRSGRSPISDSELFCLGSPIFQLNGSLERVSFYRNLRSTRGMVRTMESAVALVVHQPCLPADWEESVLLPELQRQARWAGWQLVTADGWSWGAGQEGRTVYLLHRRTSHATLQRLWSKSFIHWLQVRMSSAIANEFEEVVEVTGHFLSCPHFPLDFTTYDELERLYLAQFGGSPVERQVEADVARYLINQWRNDVEEACA